LPRLSAQGVRTGADCSHRSREHVCGDDDGHQETNDMTHTVLRIDASARGDASFSRRLTSRIIARLAPVRTISRDLGQGVPQVTGAWVAATQTPAEARDAGARATLDLSDRLIAELKAADTIVIGMPIYNFGMPASLKAWIDLVARSGVTFRYGEDGPIGLLEGKRAVVAVASGGTRVGSDIDFATGHLRHVLGFMGITDVELVAADALMAGSEEKVEMAQDRIEALAA
jgi:FMN-dependent NADH-azoreductase